MNAWAKFRHDSYYNNALYNPLRFSIGLLATSVCCFRGGKSTGTSQPVLLTINCRYSLAYVSKWRHWYPSVARWRYGFQGGSCLRYDVSHVVIPHCSIITSSGGLAHRPAGPWPVGLPQNHAKWAPFAEIHLNPSVLVKSKVPLSSPWPVENSEPVRHWLCIYLGIRSGLLSCVLHRGSRHFKWSGWDGKTSIWNENRHPYSSIKAAETSKSMQKPTANHTAVHLKKREVGSQSHKSSYQKGRGTAEQVFVFKTMAKKAIGSADYSTTRIAGHDGYVKSIRHRSKRAPNARPRGNCRWWRTTHGQDTSKRCKLGSHMRPRKGEPLSYR